MLSVLLVSFVGCLCQALYVFILCVPRCRFSILTFFIVFLSLFFKIFPLSISPRHSFLHWSSSSHALPIFFVVLTDSPTPRFLRLTCLHTHTLTWLGSTLHTHNPTQKLTHTSSYGMRSLIHTVVERTQEVYVHS